jgi:hypothetical protein
MSGINADERRIPSELDIVANAQISGLEIQNLNPKQTDLNASNRSDVTGDNRVAPIQRPSNRSKAGSLLGRVIVTR